VTFGNRSNEDTGRSREPPHGATRPQQATLVGRELSLGLWPTRSLPIREEHRISEVNLQYVPIVYGNLVENIAVSIEQQEHRGDRVSVCGGRNVEREASTEVRQIVRTGRRDVTSKERRRKCAGRRCQ
jgi:hypothetical protein